MNLDLRWLPAAVLSKHSISEILKCNQVTSRYGLRLSPDEAQELIEVRSDVLKKMGRIEFGGGMIDKLITQFSDSPFISQHNFTETLHELIETFYYFKNESLELLSDDELISLMKDFFDHRCQGSIDLLQNRELERFTHSLREGTSYNELKDNLSEEDEEEEYFYEE